MRHNKIYKKFFPCVNTNNLNHHIVPTLSEDKSDTVTIHVSVNNMMNGTDRDDLILPLVELDLHARIMG